MVDVLNMDEVNTTNRARAIMIFEVDVVGNIRGTLSFDHQDDSGIVHSGQANGVKEVRVGIGSAQWMM